jgi:hypothetical protein
MSSGHNRRFSNKTRVGFITFDPPVRAVRKLKFFHESVISFPKKWEKKQS